MQISRIQSVILISGGACASVLGDRFYSWFGEGQGKGKGKGQGKRARLYWVINFIPIACVLMLTHLR